MDLHPHIAPDTAVERELSMEVGFKGAKSFEGAEASKLVSDGDRKTDSVAAIEADSEISADRHPKQLKKKLLLKCLIIKLNMNSRQRRDSKESRHMRRLKLWNWSFMLKQR